MLSVNQKHIQVPAGSVQQGAESLYALYSLMHDRVIITYPNSKIVDDLATILSSKIVLEKFDLSQGKNWIPNLVNNSNCQNWGISGHALDFESPQAIDQYKEVTFDKLIDHKQSHSELDTVIEYSRCCLGLLTVLERVYKNFKITLRLDCNEQSRKISSYHDGPFISRLEDFANMQNSISEKELNDIAHEIKKICYWSYNVDGLKNAIYEIAKRDDRVSKFFLYILGPTWI